jgi:hypothetical protein
MAPPQNTWCEECFAAVNEGIDAPPSVTIEEENPFKGHPFFQQGNITSDGPAGGFIEFLMGASEGKQTCPNHPDGCPPYDPMKYNSCVQGVNNQPASMIELTFA